MTVTRGSGHVGSHCVGDVWIDGLGAPLVLLDDGTVHELGRDDPVVRPTYRGADDATHVARGTSGVWVIGGDRGPNFLLRPNGRVLALPDASDAAALVAHGRDAAVLLSARQEAWIVHDSGRSISIPLGKLPAEALTIGADLLIVARDASKAWLVEWQRREVLATLDAGPEPARLVPLGGLGTARFRAGPAPRMRRRPRIHSHWGLDKGRPGELTPSLHRGPTGSFSTPPGAGRHRAALGSTPRRGRRLL